MESILVINLIDAKSYNIDGVADIEIDDGGSFIFILSPLDKHEKIYWNFTKRKCAIKNMKTIFHDEIRYVIERIFLQRS